MPDSIIFKTEISEEDLIEFNLFTNRKRFLFFKRLWLALATAILASVVFLHRVRNTGIALDEVLLTLIALSLAVAAFWYLPWTVRRTVQKQLASSPSLNVSTEYRIDATGITVLGPLSTGTVLWGAFIRAVETQTCFGLYTSHVLAAVIQKRDLSAEAAHQLRSLITSKGLTPIG
jgi:YcxB-like protein